MDQTVAAPATPTNPPAAPLPRWVWLAGGGALLVISGLASALVFRAPSAAPAEVAAATPPQPEKSVAPAVVKPVAKTSTDETCKSCGVVESVVAVKKKGQGTGAGAVVGGVLGGVVGHQMGGGSGKDAMTVIGAIGGGVAGHEAEKQIRAETVYQVNLRMDDGSKRTVTLANAPVTKGDRVAVEGQNLRRLQK